ncbi:hypothetical protein [Streptomyces roseochromogenus]|uniref:hypothetical protein n=1 Tax=Streptomyces roseochromogenus TaxID=285450 RepID=UPI0005657FA9|nr:hypothetical protein [Streptomyces roseochromogenus]
MDDTVEDQRNFLRTGRSVAQADDDRVPVFRILADPTTSPVLRAAEQGPRQRHPGRTVVLPEARPVRGERLTRGAEHRGQAA